MKIKNKKAQEAIAAEVPKKSKAWLWILIILILLAVGIGAYFLLTGGSAGTGISGLGGNSIPQPPALPTG